MLIKTLLKTVSASIDIIKEALPKIAGKMSCECLKDAKEALLTYPKDISEDIRKQLSLLLDRVLQ